MSSDPRDVDTDAAIEVIHDHLVATEQLPLETTANRWIGEAEAVAEDIRYNDATESVVRDRTRKVIDLLEHVEGTGDPAGDDHVAAALERARELLAALE